MYAYVYIVKDLSSLCHYKNSPASALSHTIDTLRCNACAVAQSEGSRMLYLTSPVAHIQLVPGKLAAIEAARKLLLPCVLQKIFSHLLPAVNHEHGHVELTIATFA